MAHEFLPGKCRYNVTVYRKKILSNFYTKPAFLIKKKYYDCISTVMIKKNQAKRSHYF